MKLPIGDERLYDLLSAWGAPYSWGAGGPSHGYDAWPGGARGVAGGIGWDCSGFVQAALVRLGLLFPGAPRRSAAGLYDLSAPVPLGQERMGDLAFYGPGGRVAHVMLVLAPGVVYGARGGVSGTNADDPRAYVQIEPVTYWNAFLGVRRMPA